MGAAAERLGAGLAGVHSANEGMRRAMEVLAHAAPTDATVLIEGESGTGKSKAAEAVHASSRRAAGPLVVVDCGALSPGLVEAELFGDARGGAGGTAPGRGAFQSAHRGTLVLDEIADLPTYVQPALLRALDKRAVTPVGAASSVSVDVRVIATSSRRLRRELDSARFRADLFYRLNVVSVRLLPLRERPEDVPALAAHFLARAGAAASVADKAEALAKLLEQRDWPGNVRELENAVARMLMLDGVTDEASDLAEGSVPPGRFRDARAAMLARWEEQYVRAVLAAADGCPTHAARAAGLDYKTLRAMMKKYGVAAE